MEPPIISITKESANEVNIIRGMSETTVVSLTSLKQDVVDAQAIVDEFDAWVAEERAARQKKVDDAQAIVNQVNSLGVVEAQVADVEIGV